MIETITRTIGSRLAFSNIVIPVSMDGFEWKHAGNLERSRPVPPSALKPGVPIALQYSQKQIRVAVPCIRRDGTIDPERFLQGLDSVPLPVEDHPVLHVWRPWDDCPRATVIMEVASRSWRQVRIHRDPPHGLTEGLR